MHGLLQKFAKEQTFLSDVHCFLKQFKFRDLVAYRGVLGPLLFIIYINDFSKASQLFNVVINADDTTLSTSLNSLSETTLDNKSTETIINDEVCKINEWLNINKLLLNKSKTKWMVLHMPNKRIEALTLKIDDVYIERVDELNVL